MGQEESMVLKKGLKVSVTVDSGPMTFSPVQYNTFVVGNVSATTEVDTGDVDEAVLELRSIVRKHFAELYQERLRFYLVALRHNDRELKAAREAMREAVGHPDGKGDQRG